MRHLSTFLLTLLLLTNGSIHKTPAQPPEPGNPDSTIIETVPLPEIEAETLPDNVAQRIQTDLAQRLSLATNTTITIDNITIARHSRETWSDSCLGLSSPAESCLAALTEGWQVEAIYQSQQFFYRTDLSGNHIRRSTLSHNLPPSLQTRILQTAQTKGFGPNLSIADAQTKLWGGCYGLPTEADVCAAIGIYGWQAIVTDGDHYWIYHTDNLGNTILLNELASSNTAIPSFITPSEFETLKRETTFQSSVTGGIANLDDVYSLHQNGALSVQSPSDYGKPQRLRRATISPPQLDNFYNQLTDNNFNTFNGLLYLPKLDAAAYRIVNLRAQNGHVAFADFIFSDLPPQLQAITQSWETLQAQTETTTLISANNRPTELPVNIQSQILFNLAVYLRVPVEQVSIQNYSQQTWSDGCLGLGGPTELCLAALTEGWHVEAVDTETNQTYGYRTNLNGAQIRREP